MGFNNMPKDRDSNQFLTHIGSRPDDNQVAKPYLR